jgi:hypothetical protein
LAARLAAYAPSAAQLVRMMHERIAR